MQYLEGNDRDQMFMLSLEEAVDKDHFELEADVNKESAGFSFKGICLFLLHQTTLGMSTCRMFCNEVRRPVNGLRFGIGEGC